MITIFAVCTVNIININPKKLEVIVLMRFEGKTPKKIEEKLDKLL